VGKGTRVMLFLVKNSLVKKEVWESALSWRNSQFFRPQSSGRCRHTYSRSRRKTSQEYVKLTVWSPRSNCFEQSPWCHRKFWACSWLYSSLASPFSISVSLGFPSTAHVFFLSFSGSPSHFWDLHKIWWRSFIGSFPKSQHVRYTTPNNSTSKISTYNQLRESLVHWLPRYAVTIMYRCISLLQLLYRWKHQSRKLWIPLSSYDWN
jgi:hypothetical protein